MLNRQRSQGSAGGVACLFPKLYLFYTLWGIAFSRFFDYSDSQQESLISAI